MDTKAQCLISKDNGNLQIPYAEYEQLMKRLQEAERIKQVKSKVLAALEEQLQGERTDAAAPVQPEPAGKLAEPIEKTEKEPDEERQEKPAAEPREEAQGKKVSIEFSAKELEQAAAEQAPSSTERGANRTNADVVIPPVKETITEHFNVHDGSGRLFNVFKQYYTCLNETCGGTVRVTMKDGVCSLWNYDEWEEFAYVDIHDGNLRFAVDPRYTNDLASLEFCEVARLLATRHSLVSILVGDLNKTMLGVLTKAFNEVGLTTS